MSTPESCWTPCLGADRRAGARPHRRRDAWHSAGPARGATKRLRGRAGRRLRQTGGRRSAGQIEEGFVHRIQSLPADPTVVARRGRRTGGRRRPVSARGGAAGHSVDALAPAEAAGVIEFGPRMRFHHPLMRSAAYRAADLTERRAIHRALADATDPQSDPDRRAWHAANAAAGPDDAVAAELETSAGRAQKQGRHCCGGCLPGARRRC